MKNLPIVNYCVYCYCRDEYVLLFSTRHLEAASVEPVIRRLVADVREGLRFLWGHRLVRALTLLGFGISFTGGAVTGLTVVYGAQALDLPETGVRVGLLFSAAALGSLASSVLLPRLNRRYATGSITLAGLTAATVAVAALAFATNFIAALVFSWLGRGTDARDHQRDLAAAAGRPRSPAEQGQRLGPDDCLGRNALRRRGGRRARRGHVDPDDLSRDGARRGDQRRDRLVLTAPRARGGERWRLRVEVFQASGVGATRKQEEALAGARATTILFLALALVALGSSAGAGGSSAATPASPLGPNVIVFDPSMPVGQIQATVDAIHAQQVDAEMGTNRYALLFKPGVYGSADQPLQIKVGYYTEIAGLGASPNDVTINGKIEVYNRCLEGGGTSNCVALVNFWRTLSNLTLNINSLGQDGCRASANFWAVSQAVSMRRLKITGANLSLMDYCTAGPQFASGGFIADSSLPFVINGSQQQWLIRNSRIGGWSNAVWNQVFAGVEGAPSDTAFPNPPYTTLATTPVSREKPYCSWTTQGDYAVRVPSAHTQTSGTPGAGDDGGAHDPARRFLRRDAVGLGADDQQPACSRQEPAAHPGRLRVGRSIAVKRADTVVLGLGHATLTAVDGAVPLTVADVPGVIVAGVTIDAGTVESPVLLEVGKKNGNQSSKKGDPSNPTTLSDVYFRVGGPHIGKADVALEVNGDNVLIDHTWVWRADHGIEGFSGDTERWNTNTGRNGVVVNGDNVTATGLFVEHFQEYNVIWNGENGRTILYQNELPYDPPTQADWMHDGVEGWAGYKVGDQVKTHRLDGGGVYVFNRNNPSIHTENGFEVPDARVSVCTTS